jgi:hypothetical protein
MSRDSLRDFAHLGLLATLLQSFPNVYDAIPAAERSRMLISNPYANQWIDLRGLISIPGSLDGRLIRVYARPLLPG